MVWRPTWIRSKRRVSSFHFLPPFSFCHYIFWFLHWFVFANIHFWIFSLFQKPGKKKFLNHGEEPREIDQREGLVSFFFFLFLSLPFCFLISCIYLFSLFLCHLLFAFFLSSCHHGDFPHWFVIDRDFGFSFWFCLFMSYIIIFKELDSNGYGIVN